MTLMATPAHAAPMRPRAASEAIAGLILLGGLLAVSMAPARWSALLLLAPVAEEVIFRAGLQETLLRHLGRRHAAGARVANVVTSLAFAAAHLPLRPGAMSALTVLPALLIGWVYQRQRRLLPCVALHSVFNAIWLACAGSFT